MCTTADDVAVEPGMVTHDPTDGGAELAGVRSQVYRFLAAVYLEPPTPELVRQLADPDFLDELALLLGEPAVTELRQFADGCEPESAATALRQEYMDLFTAPTSRYVTPFEDVYRGATSDSQVARGPLLGACAIAVIRAYRAAGAEMEAACKELPTHVGVELAFMSYLCDREAEARDGSPDGERLITWRELETSFLGQHLNLWLPQLSARIQSVAAGPFYRGLALATEAFLSRDTATLGAAQSRPDEHGAAGEKWI